MRRLTKTLIAATILAAAGCHGIGHADYGHPEPEVSLAGDAIAKTYAADGRWLVSPVLDAPEGATRAAILLELLPAWDDLTLQIEARAVLADGSHGDWMLVGETFREDVFRTGHAAFGTEAEGVQLRLPADQAEAIAALTLAAAHPERVGAEEIAEVPEDGLGTAEQALSSSLRDAFGSRYRSRSQWGARASSCSADRAKYRMAIHHTASGASITDAAIRGFQTFHMRDRGWCDIGYHFLVTRDGKVFEGRPLSRMGAHVRNNNSGNLGVSLVGCFDSGSGCPSINRATGSSAVPSQTMIDTAGELVGILSRRHGIAIDRSRIRGHREHSGQTTTCPGNNVLGRFDAIFSVARSGTSAPAPAPEPAPTPTCQTPSLRFSDLGCTGHRDDILWLAGEGLTQGCGGGKYCPERTLTRGEAAAFLHRAMNLPDGPAVFSDTAGHTHARAIHAVAAAGITSGCGGGKFCPDAALTRAQMASFLSRALNLPSATGRFADVPSDHTHAQAIYDIAAVGITGGCGDGSRYCPGDAVTRAQAATFIRRSVLYLRANCHAPSNVFTDIGCSPFKRDIEWMSSSGLTNGCGRNRYCPDREVTRGEMAAFLARALGLPDGPAVFSDVEGHIHARAIHAIAAAGITNGCGGGRYCPDATVTRDQAASFIARALDLPPGPAVFSDVDGNVHADAIHALAAAGITQGCGNGRYCPDRTLERGPLAAFLARAFR
jgi:hypothetical protein